MKHTTVLKHLGVLLFATLILFQSGRAQKTLAELAALEGKKFDRRIIFDRAGFGYLKTFMRQDQMTAADLPDFDKVALLSFVLFDETYTNRVNIYNIKNNVKHFVTDDGGNYFVREIFSRALPGLREGLSQHNATLETPDTYLDNEEERQAYFNAEIEPTGLIKAVQNYIGYVKENDANAVPAGYALHVPTMAAPDVKISRSTGKLATEVGVEGFLSTHVSFLYEKGRIYLKSINIALHAPNPAPYDPDQKYPGIGATKGYWEGICFASASFNFNGKPVELARIKRGEVVSEDYEGFRQIYKKLADALMREVKAELEKLAK